jgi:hypothetical protein
MCQCSLTGLYGEHLQLQGAVKVSGYFHTKDGPGLPQMWQITKYFSAAFSQG